MTNSLPKNRISIPLREELDRIQSAIRHSPAAADLRVYFFQLLCILGHWQRAVAQLQVCAQLDAKTVPMAKTYREALRCELVRAEVFAGKRVPQTIGKPPDWLVLLIQAQQRLGSGDGAVAQALREEAFDAAPETSGKLDGTPFRWISDADSRLGPVLEAIINGQYYWIPFDQLRAIDIDAPADLRDVVWMPARLQFINDGHTVALIPSRYAGSEDADDSAKMARSTRWQQVDDTAYAGIGQRVLTTDDGDFPLMDIRHIEFDVSSD